MKKGKFGLAFGEAIERNSRKSKISSEVLEKAENWIEQHRAIKKGNLSLFRLSLVYFIFATALIVLLARSFDLQVIKGREFLGKSEGNHIQVFINHAPRGAIFDRNGKILAQNIPGFRLLVDPLSLPVDKRTEVVKKLSSILSGDEKKLSEIFNKLQTQTVTLNPNLSADLALKIEAEKESLPGVDLEVSPIRYYPYKEITSHLLGFIAEADQKDLERKIVIPYQLGDKIGKAGVEQSFEDTLRGLNGHKLVTVTANGEKKGEVYKSDPKEGRSLTISIDIDLQQVVYSALEKKMKQISAKAGSAVVLDTQTGEVLALVSIPSFDNNLFSKGLSNREYQDLVNSPNHVLLNRTLGAAYPPGSTFKMVSAVAGLETGAIKPDTKIVDPGYITLGSIVFNNWLWLDHRKTEGPINVIRAIARSTDTFFFILSQRVGEKNLAKYAQILGLGKSSGIELPGEVIGLVPTEEWKLKTKNEPWYPGETLNMSIGQGDLLVSPLQISLVTTTFANNGKLLQPTVVKTGQPKVIKDNFLKEETINTVREGLYADTIGDGNVGWLFGRFKIPSAGKTGTAESGQGDPHAWYTAYAPHPNAKIVVTVQVENAGHGSEVSAPVVKEIFDWYFNQRPN